ncbi:adenylate kinase family protein [Anaplasma capra]|uniref:adenylate kinase family protein n=1 Tax=Anaplasma capra TaxID=1562740 RepID=UPI0021D57802|nr:nucleoside monophosphate kinase [Anaplasma capra]MCU7611932.1 nucleoside monophosphate kinase [Anaplasma capra]MCU7612798.1 nucleoside monophosphate kinase [Anaplasma capra]
MEKSKINLLIFGAPGSGKGTQARMLARHLDGLRVISAGDLLRDEIGKCTEIGKEVESIMREGLLVSDALVCEMMLKKLREVGPGFLLDGFPRSLQQAEFLSVVLQILGCSIDAVIKLEVDVEVVRDRLQGRLVCRSCGKVSNISFGETVCSECGCREYVSRSDDVAGTIKRRVMEYEFAIEELERYYGTLVVKIDGNKSVDEVFRLIRDKVDSLNN